MENKEKNLGMHVSFVSIVINFILSGFKLLAGILAHSAAMVSDAVHSASDVFSTVIVIIGIKASAKSSDKEHPYGHERMECVASLLLAVALFITGATIGWNGIDSILSKSYKVKAIPGMLALIAAIFSIIVKEWMFWYTRSAAKKLNSTALMADAWHHRSDAVSSVGALIGIVLARFGFPIFDPIASLLICILILKVSIDIFREACARMVDTSADAATEKEMREMILAVDGVIEINLMTTRLFGSKMYVDVEFSADENITLKQSHDIAEQVHDKLEHKYPQIKHCMVHVNPQKM